MIPPADYAFQDDFVVVEYVGDTVNGDHLHLPAVYREQSAVNGQGGYVRISFRDRVQLCNGFPPKVWPSRCGVEGGIFVRGGVFEKTPICPTCEAIND